MTKPDETGDARFGFREQPDLRKEYRPIGIGAVAAALSVTARDQDNVEQPRGPRATSPGAGKEDGRYDKSLAA